MLLCIWPADGGEGSHTEVSNGSGLKMEHLSSAHIVQKAGDEVSCVSLKRTLVWQAADLCHTQLQGLPEGGSLFVSKSSWFASLLKLSC